MILAESCAGPGRPKSAVPETALSPILPKEPLSIFSFEAGCSPESQINSFSFLKL